MPEAVTSRARLQGLFAGRAKGCSKTPSGAFDERHLNMRFETRIQEIIQRTHDVKSFRFARPDAFDYKAGQFMFVTIKIGGEEVRKHFTISSSPTEQPFLEFTKKLTDHPFSVALANAQVGDWARLDGPYGQFTFEGEHAKIAMLSGGVGITPLRSICRFCTDCTVKSEITLLYGNRAERDIIFRDEFEAMQRQNPKLRVVLCLDEFGDDWQGRTGHITVEMITAEVPDYDQRVFYICGPPGMVNAMNQVLHELGVRNESIRTERFGGY
jgi:ferredoxin-NADP reductase